jgi:hypothetical protein
LKRVCWPLNFKLSGIEKYDGSTNPVEWFEVYHLTIEAVGGDSYVIANYLPVYLSSSARTWLLGLPVGLVISWNHLCAHLGVDSDLASFVQKKEEYLQEFIHQFCNKRNIILKVDDKSIVMFFKTGLRDSSLIFKLTKENRRTSEAMFTIDNKYALAEEVTLDTRVQKKEKESDHTDKPSSSKGHDKKRKADHSFNTVERPRCNKDYRPRSGEFEGFLDRICIFHPQKKHKTQDCDRLHGFTDEVLKTAKGADQEKKPEEPTGDFPETHKEVNYIYGGPDSYESRRKQKLIAWEVMWSHPPPLSILNSLRSPSPSTTATT